MRTVELCPDRKKYVVTIRDDGKRVAVDRFDPLTATSRKRVAVAAGVDDAVLLGWIEDTAKVGGSKTFTIADPPPVESVCWIRSMTEGRESAESITLKPVSRIVNDLLPALPVSTLLDWTDKETLCCLDIDYHESTPPDRGWLETAVLARITPKPIVWHFSRSGGLHLFYVATETQSACDLAAIAALRFRSLDSTAGLELKSVARGPGGEKVYTLPFQDEAAGFLEWLGTPEFDEDVRNDWLESEGMECGKRYDHCKCPICPTDDMGKHRQPVMVSEEGVFCFVCEGKGLALGRRRPGWASWSSILGAPSAGEMGLLIRNLAHWGHAKWVLTAKYGMPEALAKLAYRAALRAYHADRPTKDLVDVAFNPATDSLARANNLWVTVEQSYIYPKDITPILFELPAAQYVDAEGKRKPSLSAVCELNQGKDLSESGYPNLHLISGFRMTGQYLSNPSDPATVAVVNPKLTRKSSRSRPQYVPKTKRMPIDDAWAIIESVFPRIDRTLVVAAICSFACAQETKSGMLPTVFISGPSGAAKTSTIKVAASIYGSKTADVVHESDTSRFRQSVMQGGTECPVILMNEILKDSARGRLKLNAKEALDPILNLTEDSQSWVAFRGPAKLGRLPAIFFTETNCPLTLRDETQLARRIRHHRVHGRKDEWKGTTAAVGLSDFHLLRTVSDRMNAACDAILSDVCDTWFSTPRTWDAIADALNIRTIEESSDFDDLSPYLKEFFRLVSTAVDLPEKYCRLFGPGYKKISRSETAPSESDADTLVSVYTMFADGGGAEWLNSRRLLEKDWSAVLRTDSQVWLDMKNDGVNVFVRFRSGPAKQAGTKFNGQIVDPSKWETL